MKTSYEKKRKRLLSLTLSMLLMFNVASIEVEAASNVLTMVAEVEAEDISGLSQLTSKMIESKNARALLYNCTINVYSSSSGLQATFSTNCAQEASSIGVKDIKIKQKVWYGWKLVATSDGGGGTDTTMYMGSVLYANAIKGETYRISCVHYADADVYTELDNEVDIIFTY